MVQGWIVTDRTILASVGVSEEETLVEVPAALLRYLALDGLEGEVINQPWLRGQPFDPDIEAQWWRPWFELMAHNTQAGKTLRRLRIISEPVTDYIRFEWHDAAQLIRAGKDVRWLPRRHTSTLLLPGNDFWMFDRRTVAFTHFSGDGHVLDHQVTTDPDVVATCAAAFEQAWQIAIPHNRYTPS